MTYIKCNSCRLEKNRFFFLKITDDLCINLPVSWLRSSTMIFFLVRVDDASLSFLNFNDFDQQQKKSLIII